MVKQTSSEKVLDLVTERIKDKPYKVWELIDYNEPKIDCTCTFNFDEEYFLLDKPFGKYQSRNDIKGCKEINKLYDELKEKVTNMVTIGHKFIEGECLDEVLNE